MLKFNHECKNKILILSAKIIDYDWIHSSRNLYLIQGRIADVQYAPMGMIFRCDATNRNK
jgi:hypothetical protein